GVFKRLQQEPMRANFDARLLTLLRDTPFTGLVVVVDKKAQLERVKSPLHPYHYCLAALLERYCDWLAGRRGDVMGESRGRREDIQLQAAYRAIFDGGTLRVTAGSFQQSL